jgi:hypothetical protein
MNATQNEWQKVSKGRITMEISSFLGEHRGGFMIGYNQESQIDDDEVPLAVGHALKTLEIDIPVLPYKPRHGWKMSTLVGFIYENQLPKVKQETPL